MGIFHGISENALYIPKLWHLNNEMMISQWILGYSTQYTMEAMRWLEGKQITSKRHVKSPVSLNCLFRTISKDQCNIVYPSVSRFLHVCRAESQRAAALQHPCWERGGRLSTLPNRETFLHEATAPKVSGSAVAAQSLTPRQRAFLMLQCRSKLGFATLAVPSVGLTLLLTASMGWTNNPWEDLQSQCRSNPFL